MESLDGNQILVGLTGYAQSGKDAFAGRLISHHGFVKVAFADALRSFAYAINPQVGVDTYRGLIDSIGYETAKTNYPEVRRLLQAIGTEGVRDHFGQDTWVEVARAKWGQHHRVVVTDVRFPNEAAAVIEERGVLYRVERPGVGPLGGHVSESHVAAIPAALVVRNAGTLEDLWETADVLVGGLVT